jgi:ADP-ribose pyrophosphatase
MKHTILYEGKFLRLLHYRGWEFVKRKDCTGIVVIVPITSDKKVIFVEQYRVPLGKNVIEFPAGLVGDLKHARKESMKTAALRELFEETGYLAKKMEFILEGPVSAGMSAQQIAFFRASQLKKMGTGGGDLTENILVHNVPLKKAAAWLFQMQKKGKLIDPKVFAGLFFLQKPDPL